MASLTSDQIPISSYSTATTELYQNVSVDGAEAVKGSAFRRTCFALKVSLQTISHELFSVCVDPGAAVLERCPYSLQQIVWVDDVNAFGFDDHLACLERELR